MKKNFIYSFQKEGNRTSNFELLRILAMFLIVSHHCAVHGIFPYWQNNVSTLGHINNFFCFCISSCGKVGVTLFVLLSGYFLCKQKFRIKKYFNIYFKTLFISILIFLLFYLLKPADIGNAWTYSFFPFSNSAYWFVTSYLLLYVFSPLLNVVLEKCSPKILKIYLILTTIIWSILPYSYNVKLGYSVLLWFMYLYVFGSCLRLNYICLKQIPFLLVFIAICIYCISYVYSSILFLGNKINLWIFANLTDLNSMFTLILSLWLFYIFSNFKIQSSLINWLASSMFGVYLLHDNNLVRPYLWHTILQIDLSMNSPYFVLYALMVSCCVFGICIILDKLLLFFLLPIINLLSIKAENIVTKLPWSS